MNIKLTDKDKIRITDSDDLYAIMQRILLRENKIDREKEHFWIVGMNRAAVILYIELVSMGSVKATLVELMNVFRVAILKGASHVIGIHNHPAGTMKPSEADKDITDRLIQVGKIIDIRLEDHLIISPTTYFSFANTGLMAELEASTKYIPTYQLVEKVRREETDLRRAIQKELKDKIKKYESTLKNAVDNLTEKLMTVEQIADILNITTKEVQRYIKKKRAKE